MSIFFTGIAENGVEIAETETYLIDTETELSDLLY